MAKTEQQRIYDGERAREVLENEAFAAAFADIKSEITKQWMESPARDSEAREKLYLMLKLLDKVKTTMESSLADGKMAKLEVEHERTIAQRVADAVTWR